MKRKLVLALACRNQGTRLYGKPFQNLDIKEDSCVLEYMINMVTTIPAVDEIVLGISQGVHNLSFVEFCERNNLSYIIGDEEDVLSRLIQCGEKGQATDVFRLTSESPFTYFDAVKDAWAEHVRGDYDFTCLDWVPDGCGFEIIKIETLKYAHTRGSQKHRSEFCSLYIRENKGKFKIQHVDAPPEIKRSDIRLTIDYPEDLILCRAVYSHFKDKAPRIPVGEIIKFLDANPDLKKPVEQFVEEGLETMNL
ncbi:MAG: acylneuraminate cytidylyltransferase [Planctomycetes bacterium]|nr:acylneuraminate cytidylyltransferase [Planctomycetota bacterium]